ncbi:uncharacterized protein F13E9.13, mitochondrial [Lycorma delicatula]|uniref:uncharacterized protein F13E9.13, mitochondrial n=1 Tax=Lycorma delicatula TaxID=130591 RepID=UPI003F519118
MFRFQQLFPKKKCIIIGMIHIGALPGTPCYKGSVEKLIEKACSEAEVYKKCSVDAVLLENMHDIPYMQPPFIGPEITSSMTKVCSTVRNILQKDIKCGVQVLAGGNKEAIAVAQSSGLDFVRIEGFVFSHIADEGFTNSCAGELLRYRKTIGAENILIFTDVKKKHSAHALTNDISLEETAHAAEFFLSDGVIVTGTATGKPADVAEVNAVKKSVNIPVLVGSGVTIDNVNEYLGADGLIIGTYFKKHERWENEVCETRVKDFMEKVNKF